MQHHGSTEKITRKSGQREQRDRAIARRTARKLKRGDA